MCNRVICVSYLLNVRKDLFNDFIAISRPVLKLIKCILSYKYIIYSCKNYVSLSYLPTVLIPI